MLACIDEALRLYPPAPFLSQRLTPPGITEIAGYEVPGGVSSPTFISSRRYCLDTTKSILMPLQHPCRLVLVSLALQQLAPLTTSSNPTASIRNAGLKRQPRISSLHSSTMPAIHSSRSSWVPARVWEETWRTTRCAQFWRDFSGDLISSCARKATVGSKVRRRTWSGTSRL